jgi:carbohydrate kinase (thermoresistant glucokinase family)
MGAAARPDVVVVMGVSSVGKSTVAKGISTLTGWPFAEGDGFHPQANIDKMHAGTPLTDDDRWPWLRLIRDWMAEQIASGESGVVTCSALREAYRDVLREAGPEVRFLHLVAGESLVGDRMSHRSGHFMPPSLLHSQYDTLEPLTERELDLGSVVVPVDGSPPEVLHRAMTALGLDHFAHPEHEGDAR